MNSPARTTPAIERNREPIARALDGVLPDTGLVLEIASGPGAHAAFLAQRYPGLRIQPTDRDAGILGSASAWVRELERDNLLSPLVLDVTSAAWPVERANAVVNINMLHVSPFPRCATGLFSGAARVLGTGEPLAIYGPFLRADVPTAASNMDFDASLRRRDSSWGIRNLEDVEALASEQGLSMDRMEEMPSNNLMLIFRRS